MSVQHILSQEALGANRGLPENCKQSELGNVTDTGLCSGRVSTTKDKSVHEPNTIGFLNQCKFELSAEVIRWKEENHKLRREKETSEQKIQELRSVLDSLIRKNEELEASLLSSNQQFEKLKMHSIAINEENKFLHQKLSKTCTKYYSYPWSEFGVSPMLPLLNGNIHQLSKREVGVPKSWEEVSEKLIEQMKLEMKELQMLGQKLAINDLSSSTTIQSASHSLNDQYVSPNQTTNGSDVEDSIVNLACDLELLKKHLKGQQQKLAVLLNRVSDCEDLAIATDAVQHTQNNVLGVRKVDSTSSLMDWGASDTSGRKFIRPSDDSFRAYFTQQLRNSKSTEDLKYMLNFYVDSSKGFFSQSNVQNIQEDVKMPAICAQTRSKCRHNVDVPTHSDDSCVFLDETIAKPLTDNSLSSAKNCFPEEERVCPICEAVFPRIFSQKEFESHVVAHLEAGSASLLDQYEIL